MAPFPRCSGSPPTRSTSTIPQTGAILDANERACALHGCTIDELRTLGFGGISGGMPPMDAAEGLHRLRRAAAGSKERFDWVMKRCSGEGLRVEVLLNPVDVGGARRVLSNVRDLTERSVVSPDGVILEARSGRGSAPLSEPAEHAGPYP
jgi:PAS domain S-box-containing protein